jgi:hypothetical protein
LSSRKTLCGIQDIPLSADNYAEVVNAVMRTYKSIKEAQGFKSPRNQRKVALKNVFTEKKELLSQEA